MALSSLQQIIHILFNFQMYFLNVYFTSHLLLSFKMATCKSENGKLGNGMSGMRGIMATRGLRVGTQGIQERMRGIRVGTRGQQLTDIN